MVSWLVVQQIFFVNELSDQVILSFNSPSLNLVPLLIIKSIRVENMHFWSSVDTFHFSAPKTEG